MAVRVRQGISRPAQAMAAFVVLVVLIQLVFVQLPLALAMLFTLVARVTRWHRSWLLAPAAVGLVWALVAGPGHVIAGFAAGPAQILRYFGHGHLLGRLSHPLAAFAGTRAWLPGQLPVALLAGAVETAAAIGWLGRPRAGQPALPPRPGVLAIARGALAGRKIRAGAVLTRNGCALGVVRATGAVAELRWAEIADGAVVAGPVSLDVTVACLQVAHAALRRRKPLIVIDPRNDAAITRAVAAACAATGTPLRHGGQPAAARSPAACWPAGYRPEPAAADAACLDGALPAARSAAAGSLTAGSPGARSAAACATDAGLDLRQVVCERAAILLPAGSPRLADLACRDVAALAAELRQIGADGDGLVWVTAAESLPRRALAVLVRDCGAAGLPVLIAATSPATVAELAGSASAVLTVAPRRPLSGRSWQFSLAVAAPLRRQTRGARLVPARLPSPASATPPPVVPNRTLRTMPARLPHEAASPGGGRP